MENIVKQKLVSGRAGELADTADLQTFELLEKIFGHKGPYRKILKKFGIGNSRYSESFLVLKEGKVLTDIDKETEALWKSCMHKLVFDGKRSELKLDLRPATLLRGLPGLVFKTIKEVLIVAEPEKFLKEAELKFEMYSLLAEKTLKTKAISEKDFLKAYESVVYITYLYELFFNINLSDNFESNTLREYVRNNDYLLKYDESYTEFAYRNVNGFAVGDGGVRHDPSKIKLIPNVLPVIEGAIPSKYAAEKKLQCMKNNLRLKTNILLHFLK